MCTLRRYGFNQLQVGLNRCLYTCSKLGFMMPAFGKALPLDAPRRPPASGCKPTLEGYPRKRHDQDMAAICEAFPRKCRKYHSQKNNVAISHLASDALDS